MRGRKERRKIENERKEGKKTERKEGKKKERKKTRKRERKQEGRNKKERVFTFDVMIMHFVFVMNIIVDIFIDHFYHYV